MTEIPYKNFQKILNSIEVKNFPHVFLIHGEEFLYKNALDKIVDILLPEPSRIMNFDPLDGINENIPKAVERINTYSLIPGKKIVALRDANIFYSKEDKWSLFQKAKTEVENNDLKRASGYFLKFLGSLELNFTDLNEKDRHENLGVEPDENLCWIDQIMDYCRNENLFVTKDSLDYVEQLVGAIEKGFPKGHYLAITSDTVGKGHRLYKTIKEHGWIVDCSVPKGEKRADKIQQELVINERMRAILSKRGKSIEKDAYYAMLDMIGFDIRTFINELEKLINYVGDRETVTLPDVKELLKQTRQEPVFEFTNAVTDRNLESSLLLLDSVLSAGMHPLQVLTAIANQIRKLINTKSFVENPLGSVWRKGTTYNSFQKNVIASVMEYDQLLRNRLDGWESGLEKNKLKGKKNRSKTKSAETSDLFMMKNSKNPYPTYQLLKKSDNFSMADLQTALSAVKDTDMLMKSTSQNPRRALEAVVFKICCSENVKHTEPIG